MDTIFDINILRDIFEEVHIPRRHSKLASSHQIYCSLSKNLPSWAGDYIDLVDYIYDDEKNVIGAKIECDLGGGYYAEEATKIVEAYPGKEVSFSHYWTGVDDDGCPEDNSTDITFMLSWHEEGEEK